MRSVYFILLALLSQIAIADTGSTGRICIASVEPPNNQPKSLSNPSGGNPDIAYSLRIGDQPKVQISREKGRWIEGLPIDTKLPVVIYEDGNRTASFFVKLSEDETSKCVFLNSLYLTWQAWNWDRTGPWCNCPTTEEEDTSGDDTADMSGIGCPEGTQPAGETVPEVREAWCELHTDEGVLQHGPYRAWYPNGNLGTAGQFDAGRQVGQWLGWYESGAKQGEIVYEDGEIVSEVYWTEDGVEASLPNDQ